MKSDQHIVIVHASRGGLSSMGKKSSDMLAATLQKRYKRVDVCVVNTVADLNLVLNLQPDLVFLGMKMLPDASAPLGKIWLADYLQAHGIAYTGSPASAIALDFDKPAAKRVVHMARLNTAIYFTASPGEYRRPEELPLRFPLFIKPPNAGGGKGISADSVVRTFSDYVAKVAYIQRNFNTAALVEKYLPGREFSVAIIDDPDNEQPLALPLELITEPNEQGDRILGQTIKAADTEHVIAVSDSEVKTVVSELALEVFSILGARHYGRIDIRLDQHGTPYFLEANLVPGLAFHDFVSYFTSACRINLNMSYDAMVNRIVELGLLPVEIPNTLQGSPVMLAAVH